ncbi:testisin isoform X1 [Microplitis demolitor]|uniref:testisin isoform X1 n=1 Tax=Microplitis demolitor TaxID=69319 RepID=UPI0004CD2827|nr:testisin isoform X1 [Microplitis demolitor]
MMPIKCKWYKMALILTLMEFIYLTNGQSPNQSASNITDTKNRTSNVPHLSTRRKRFVRYPSAGNYLFENNPPGVSARIGYPIARFSPVQSFQPAPSVWRQAKSSFWRSPIENFPSRPVLAHRTPRLIFRDDFPTFPASGVGSSFFQTNQLSPEVDDEFRDQRKQIFTDYPKLETEKSRTEKKPAWEGDDSLCSDGRSCEFFLKCWMTSGLLDGSCGGIMYACCHRKDAKAIAGDYNLIETPREQLLHPQLASPDNTNTEHVSDDHQCGISSSKQTAQRRIVGGDDAGFGSFPWQAYIRIGSSRCGGTLVNRYHVVTAGHCVAKASARQVQVTLGDYVVNSATENLPAYTFGVREIRVHPYFKFTPQADRFDVAVLRLDRPVHYMPHISPICLPDKNEDFLGQYGWAAGWGALQAGSRLRPKTLQSVDVPVIDNRVCERWHRSNGINVVIYDEMMCAGYRGGGKDSCQGDSGGPLMLEKTGRWYLIGIVSAGYSCAQPGQPGIYHRVAKTVDWITYVINS